MNFFNISDMLVKYKYFLYSLLFMLVIGMFILIEHKGYQRGVAETKLEYKELSFKLSKDISNSLQSEFSKQQEKLNSVQEINHEKLSKVLEEYKSLNDCHNSNGIGLLNEQIRKRYTNPSTPPKL